MFAKRIVGYKWDKERKVWTYPLDLITARRIREIFGDSLRIGPQLSEWAVAAKEREKELLALHDIDMSHAMQLPNVEQMAPAMHAAMLSRGYQTVVPHFGMAAGNFLNADQPGLGKTLETFGTLVEAGISGHVLVLAPKTSLSATWAAEVDKWMGECDGIAYVADGSNERRNKIIRAALDDKAHRYVFLLVNPEMARLKEIHECDEYEGECKDKEFCPNPKQHKVTRVSSFPALFDTQWDAIIGDEVHRVLMHANPRARKVTQVGLGYQRLRSRIKIALSGTPMRGKPRLLWPTLHWLRPDLYGGQWKWSTYYFATQEDSFAETGQRVTDELRPEREQEFNRELGRMMIRRTKHELRALNSEWAPPDKRYVEVWLEMTPSQRRIYKQMEKDAVARLKSGSLTANGILAEMTRLRQFSNSSGDMDLDGHYRPDLPSNKIDWLFDEFLGVRGIYGEGHDLEAGDSKVVIASQFTQFLNLISNLLDGKEIRHHLLTGETNRGDYFAQAQQEFQRPGGPRVCLVNTTAGGVSITLDAADDMAILDETWVPDDQEQVEDRIHRTGRTDHQVTIYYVRTEDSIERVLAGTNMIKDDRQKRSLDGRRGIEVARVMVEGDR